MAALSMWYLPYLTLPNLRSNIHPPFGMTESKIDIGLHLVMLLEWSWTSFKLTFTMPP